MKAERMVSLRPNDEAFFAMLGTPNGAGSAYLLMQHKRVLGFKMFSEIVAGFDFEGSPLMIFKAVDIPSPRLLYRGDGNSVCNSSETWGNGELLHLESRTLR